MKPQLLEIDADLLGSQLQAESTAQNDLLCALEEIESHMVANELDKLEARLENLSPLLGRIESLVKRREKIVLRFGERVGVAAGPGTLRELIALMPSARADELSELRLQAQRRASDLDAKNRRVRVIVRDLSRLNDDIVGALFGVEVGERSYDSRGERRRDPRRSILDRSY